MTDQEWLSGQRDFMRRMLDQHNDGSQSTTEHTLQADYTTPVGKMHTIEAGAKYILHKQQVQVTTAPSVAQARRL